MWRARRTNFSRNTSAMPKAVPASRRACSRAVVELVGRLRRRACRGRRRPWRLDDHRIAELARPACRASALAGPVASLPASIGHARLLGDAAGDDLVAELLEDLGRGPTNMMPGLGAGPGELGVLGQEAVAGMDGIDVVLLGEGDDAGDVEVARGSARRACRRGTPRRP